VWKEASKLTHLRIDLNTTAHATHASAETATAAEHF
jgi:hypothetical protein